MSELAFASVRDYGVFDLDVAVQSERITRSIRQYHELGDYLSDIGVPDNPEPVTSDGQNAIEVLRIPAALERKGALVVGLAMANPLDAGQIFQVAVIAECLPGYDVIAVANPSWYKNTSGLLTKKAQHEVRRGNLRPVVDPILKYVETQGDYDHLAAFGYSYGADIATAVARHADSKVRFLTTLEPASSKSRSLINLGGTFKKTADAFPLYVEDSDMSVFQDARELSLSSWKYNTGLMRLSNLAISQFIARGEFSENMSQVLEVHPGMVHNGFWAGASEFGNGTILPDVYEDLENRFGERVNGYELMNQKHAVGNHIPTIIAVVLQSMRNAA